MAKDKDQRKLLKALAEQGFQIVERRTPGHYGIYAPDGEHVTDLGGTPSDYRGAANALARLRRAGYIDPAREARRKKGDRRS